MRALAELFDRLGVELLVVEDAHWADEATLELLLFLTARQPPGISVLVTYRPEDVPAGSLLRRLSSRARGMSGHLRLTLNPLDTADTAALVSSMLGGEHMSAAFAEFLHTQTDGLPLAIEESVRLLRDRADLVRVHEEWTRRSLDEIAVPPTIRDAVLERIGVADVCMVVCDGLTGLPDAVGAVWPAAITQTCIVHRSRKESTRWFGLAA